MSQLALLSFARNVLILKGGRQWESGLWVCPACCLGLPRHRRMALADLRLLWGKWTNGGLQNVSPENPCVVENTGLGMDILWICVEILLKVSLLCVDFTWPQVLPAVAAPQWGCPCREQPLPPIGASGDGGEPRLAGPSGPGTDPSAIAERSVRSYWCFLATYHLLRAPLCWIICFLTPFHRHSNFVEGLWPASYRSEWSLKEAKPPAQALPSPECWSLPREGRLIRLPGETVELEQMS